MHTLESTFTNNIIMDTTKSLWLVIERVNYLPIKIEESSHHRRGCEGHCIGDLVDQLQLLCHGEGGEAIERRSDSAESEVLNRSMDLWNRRIDSQNCSDIKALLHVYKHARSHSCIQI